MDGESTTRIDTEFLCSLHSPMGAAPQAVDAGLTIYQTGVGGWARGPKLSGEILTPTGDWLRALPGGCLRVDARMSLKTQDGALVYIEYGGVISVSAENFARMSQGARLTAEDMYFITTPQFRTAAPQHAWLNHVQAIGKLVALQGGEGGYVRYDLFAIR
ncbi:MAG TPA: DUF3237 domain-containing protein [Ramlibacter sp.]|nr:DUF3237 domain-containing protein [Ramlibacter sp.]